MSTALAAETLAGWAREERERWHVPGLAVGLLQDGGVTSAADGVRELGNDDSVSPDTVFRIASITKPFVATLALTLVQEGRLALDEPPPGTRVEATVRQLLSHQGGLACEWPSSLDEVGSDDDALLRVAEAEPALLPVGPGELYSYCNVGFWLVGAAAARSCGATFEEAMRSRVLAPLGLARTGFEAEHGAPGHDQVEPGADEHRPVGSRYPRVRRPSGGLWSSVEDLLRFGAHHLGAPGPLTRRSIAAMQEPQIDAPGGAYGLGWGLRTAGGRRIVEHGGSVGGYQSRLLLVPEDRLAFAALTNSSRGSAAIRGLLERLGVAPDELPDARLSDEELDAFAGRYEGQFTRVAIGRADGALSVQLTELNPLTGESLAHTPVRARPVGEREFEIADGEWRGDRLDFPRDGLVRMAVLASRVE